MTAASELRARADEKYPSYRIEFEDGFTVSLKSVMKLGKAQRKDFTTSATRLATVDENEDIDALHEEFIEILAGVSDNPDTLRAKLSDEDLGFLTVLFQDYVGGLAEGTKSE